MGLIERVKREVTLIGDMRRTLKAYGNIGRDSPETVADDIERTCDRFPERPAFVFEGRTMSYAEFEALANRYAHWARAQGLRPGDVVALFMPNRPDYVAVWFGLAKVGVATALINTGLTGRALVHSIDISGARQVILDAELAEPLHAVASQLANTPMVWASGGAVQGAQDLDEALARLPSERIPPEKARPGLTGGAVAMYIYTSGTTGLPKAAKMAHWRVMGYMRAFWGAGRGTEQDRVYIPLPLYHSTGGLCGVGFALEGGGAIILRRKFSASQFWSDVREQHATVFFYIGELCRYLVNVPPSAEDGEHAIRLAVGNGLRPEVWERFQERFKVPRIMEFYGSTEGNVSLVNLDGKQGAIGRIPSYLRRRFNVRIVKFDFENEQPLRGPDGLCIEAAPGEAGEAIGEIKEAEARFRFEGYAGDKAQTEKKVLRDVFRQGDAWFRTGDLMRQDEEGYFYFVDRVGDTFRWKGENVSTHQVNEVLSVFPGVKDANVYGVQVGDLDGRAGMAAITTDPGLDLAGLRQYLARELPSFARPLFLRLQPEIATTGTFKHRKVDLVKEGFDPAVVRDPLLFDDPRAGAYVPLTPELREEILAGRVRL